MTVNLPSAMDSALTDRITRRLELVEARLRQSVAHADQFADSVSRHLVEAGGKRVRPMLTLLAAELGDADRPEVVEAAVAVELTHLATLYHDDVMDGAPTRRGAPAAHQVWGNSVAILTGDLLFARASRLISELGADAVKIQAETFERLCLGQLHETVGPAPDEDPVEHYIQVLADKTGSLVATCGHYGTLFAGCDRAVVEILVEYGELVGIAFQLADDVIDLSDQVEVTGKAAGTDLREGVPTMPVLLLRARAETDPSAGALLERVQGDLSDDTVLADVVHDLSAHPVTEETRLRARHYSARAVEVISALPEGPVRTALTDFATAAVNRVS